MNVLLHILKFKILSFIKPDSRITFKSFLKNSAISSVYLLFAAGNYFFTLAVITYLLEDVKIGTYLLHRFIFAVLFIFFITVNIGNIVVSYSTFFKTKEVAFLLTKPVSFVRIFMIKFLDNFFYSSSTLLLMVTASLSAYSDYFGLPWQFIPFAVLFLTLPFMFISGTLGSIMLLAVLRLAEVFGVKRVLIIIASVYAGTVILFYLFSSPVDLVTRVFANFPYMDQYFGFLESPVIKLLPNHWFAEALYWIAVGKYWSAGWYIYLLIITSILFFLLALFLAKKWFYKTWLVFLNISGELCLRKKNINKRVFSLENNSSLEPGREVLLKRELLLFMREPSQWVHFAVMLFLIIIFIVSISTLDVIILKYYNVYLKTLIYLIIFLFNVFLIASLSLRFVFPLVSLEGEAIWKIRSAPVSYKKLMLTRLTVYFLIIFSIGQLLNFVSNYQFSILLTAISQLNTVFITLTLVSLNFGMGAAFANYRERNPVRIASSQGASLTFLFTIIYLIFLIILLFAPVSNYFYAMDSGGAVSISQLLYTNLILAAHAFIFSFISISRGLRYLHKDI